MAERPGPDFETTDVPPMRAALWAYGLFAIAVAIAGLVGGLLWVLSATTYRGTASPVEETRVVPPSPRLQASPEGDLARLRAAEQRRLDGQGWVDRKAGLAHIPIGQATRLLAERGWPQQGNGEGSGQ